MKGLIALVAVGVLTNVAIAAEPLAWPQFRGPNASGVAEGQKPPVEIGPNKNVKWKVACPGGLSSPIVAGDKLVVTAFEDGKFLTIAYGPSDGKEAWRAQAPAKEVEPYYKAEGSPASSTSATDGQRIVSYFGSCGLFCYDLSGKELWKLEMPPAETAGGFGSGVSPVIADGTVILLRDDAKNPRILALDAASGKPRWEKKRQSPVSYCTPVVWDTASGWQIAAGGHGRMIGYDLKTGEEKWWVSGMPSACCTTPVIADGTLYFAGWSPGGTEDKEFQMPSFDAVLKMGDADKDGILVKEELAKTPLGGMFDPVDGNKDGKLTRDEWDTVVKFMAEGKNSAFAVKAGGQGDITNTHVLWKKTKGLPYVPSPLVYRGQVLMVKDGGLVTAYDAKTGKELYAKRLAAQGRYYASPVAANGHIYFASVEGVITVAKAGDNPESLGENAELGERIGATPAIADDTLYVRTEKHLYAFGAKK